MSIFDDAEADGTIGDEEFHLEGPAAVVGLVVTLVIVIIGEIFGDKPDKNAESNKRKRGKNSS